MRKGDTILFETPPRVTGYGSVGGRREARGPLAKEFDTLITETQCGEKTWEKAESTMQRMALQSALDKAGQAASALDYVFAGDLLNQCIASSFAVRGQDTSFFGLYGACSTMAQTLLLASILVESGAAEKALAVTSSHFCSAERQFRLPLEYGGQRAPTAQWTATAAGCALVGLGGKVRVARGLAGAIQDLGVKDPANMGAAMAPAAAASLYQFLQDTGTSPGDYDGIFTGDLGAVGSQLLYQCLEDNHVDVRSVHQDCGLLLYDRQRQDVHAGGSGCGCSASVLCGYLLGKMEEGQWKKILFAPTGALLSPVSTSQGESIPGICHAVCIQATDTITS